jgi:hypothetical protein
MRNEKAPCQQIDTELTRAGSLKVLETLAAAYEKADAYNRPAIEFVLRQMHGHYLTNLSRSFC